MGILGTMTASAEIIATTIPVQILNIDFISHTSDVTVEIKDGGSSGTTVWKGFVDATDGIGDLFIPKNFSEKGGALSHGLYITITGITTVNYECIPRAVAGR